MFSIFSTQHRFLILFINFYCVIFKSQSTMSAFGFYCVNTQFFSVFVLVPFHPFRASDGNRIERSVHLNDIRSLSFIFIYFMSIQYLNNEISGTPKKERNERERERMKLRIFQERFRCLHSLLLKCVSDEFFDVS